MKSKTSWLVKTLVVSILAVPVAMAQNAGPPVHFSGLINDYTPSNVKGGPYEMRGTWSLNLHGQSGTADFTASMNMETSDYGILETIVDPTDPTTRGAHTHHIELTNATVVWNMDGCPTFSPPTNSNTGFQVTGTVSLITGNGSQAPFEPAPPSSPTSQLQVCISGGTGDNSVAFSNITLVFLQGSPAIKHFGPKAIHGVVSKVN